MLTVSTELLAAAGTLISLNFLFSSLHKHKLARISKKRKEACIQMVAYAIQASGKRFQYSEIHLAYLIAQHIAQRRKVDITDGPDEKRSRDIESILELALPITWALRLDTDATCYIAGMLLGHTLMDKRTLDKVNSPADEESLLERMDRDVVFMTGVRRQKASKESIFNRISSDKKMLEAGKAFEVLELSIKLPVLPSDYKVDLT